MHKSYPGIARAAHLISLDNGGCNRFRPEADRLTDLDRFLARASRMIDMRQIDQWLEQLSDEDLDEFCCGGDDSERKAELLLQAPPFTDTLLDEFFDEAC